MAVRDSGGLRRQASREQVRGRGAKSSRLAAKPLTRAAAPALSKETSSTTRVPSFSRAATQHRLPPMASRIPMELEAALEEQRRELCKSMTLLYCVHCALGLEQDDVGESTELNGAIGWIHLRDVTEMILVRLHAIHLALDSVSLRQATAVVGQ